MYEYFVWVVVLLALAYAVLIQVLRNKFVDMGRMNEIQKRMNDLNKEFKEAQKRKDERRMQELLKQQTDLMPEMGKQMWGQVKMMIPTLLIFFGFMALLAFIDPNTKDDIVIPMVKQADGSFRACYLLDNANYAAWSVTATAYKSGQPSAINSTEFFYNVDRSFGHVGVPKPMNDLPLELEKHEFRKGDEVCVTARPAAQADEVTASMSNGTSFYTDLPFAIPVLEVRRLNDANGLFIILAIIFGLVYAQLIKKKTPDAKVSA
ncbi:MAG: EMC3/TMCO1 family protein [Candidatus Bilamarchaeaceae archaeon]